MDSQSNHVSLITCIFAVAISSGCDKPESTPVGPRPVRVVRVNDTSAVVGGYLPGRAKATKEVNLSFRVSGPLIELPVNVGDAVKKGDIVARIDPRDFQVAYRGAAADLATSQAQLKAMQVGARPEEIAQLKAAVQKAEVRLRTATNELTRVKDLVATNVITQSEYDRYLEDRDLAEAELRQAREDLRIGEKGAREEDLEAKAAEIRSLEAVAAAAKDQWAYSYLRAPFDGVIVATFVENFQEVRAKEQIVRLIDNSKIEMVVNVPEGSISLVPYVKDIVCEFDAFPELQIPAEVKEIGAEASRTTRTYPVTLIMDQPSDVQILPGMAGRTTGRLDMPENSAGQRVEIPESALFERDGKRYVWVVQPADGKNSVTELREVELGELSPRGLRNVKGPQPGELVVTAGVFYLKSGQKVRVME